MKNDNTAFKCPRGNASLLLAYDWPALKLTKTFDVIGHLKCSLDFDWFM